jgi:hypothetical protein
MQAFPHRICPDGHAQLPAVHVWPGAQALPQVPQFPSSLASFTQAAGRTSTGHRSGSNGGHWHAAPEQISPATRHAAPQPPQFAGSFWKFVQAVAHSSGKSGGHSHSAEMQSCLVLHAFAHPARPTPQLLGSFAVLVQIVPHSVRSPKHPQVPASHVQPTSCTLQLVSHVPHAAASFCRSRQRGESLLHSVVPGPHEQEPPEHVAPGPQSMPQPPQLLASVW